MAIIQWDKFTQNTDYTKWVPASGGGGLQARLCDDRLFPDGSHASCIQTQVGGSGCTLDLTLSGGAITAASIHAGGGGSGYKANACLILAVTGGAGSGCTLNLTVTNGVVTAAAVNAAGSGYAASVNVTLNVTGGGGQGCKITATINGSGNVSSVVILDGGYGYSNTTGAATAIITAGLIAVFTNGSGVVSGVLAGTYIVAAGTGYSGTSAIATQIALTKQLPALPNYGTGCTLNMTQSGGALSTVPIAAGGSNYPVSTQITLAVTGGGGSGGTVLATTNAAGNVIDTSIVAAGSGYSNNATAATLMQLPPGSILNGLDIGDSQGYIYGAIRNDSGGNPYPSLQNVVLRPGVALYARFTVTQPNIGINIALFGSTPGTHGPVPQLGSRMTINFGQDQCTISSSHSLFTDTTEHTFDTMPNFGTPANYGSNIEVWLVCRRMVNGKPEVEMWYAAERHKNRPICIWRDNEAAAGQNCTWYIGYTGTPKGGMCLLREVIFGTGTDNNADDNGLPDALIDPLQGPRDTFALTANPYDISAALTDTAQGVGFSTGGGYCYDPVRAADFSISQIATSDGPFDGTGVLYVRKNNQWQVQHDAAGNHIFDVDVTHQRPALWVSSTIASSTVQNRFNSNVNGFSNVWQFIFEVGGSPRLLFNLGTAQTSLYSGRGVVTNAASGQIQLAPQYFSHTSNMPSSGNMVAAWYTPSGGYGQIHQSSIASYNASTGQLTLTLSGGDALPVAGTMVLIGTAANGATIAGGSNVGTFSGDMLYAVMSSPQHIGYNGWEIMPCCEPSVSASLLMSVASTAVDTTSAPNGVMFNKSDRIVYTKVSRATTGDIVAMGARALTDYGNAGIYRPVTRRLAAGAALTAWSAETDVQSTTPLAYYAMPFGSMTSPPCIGTFELYFQAASWGSTPVAVTMNGFPVYANFTFNFYLFVYNDAWTIGTNYASPSSANIYWIGPSPVEAFPSPVGSYPAANGNASAAITLSPQLSDTVSTQHVSGSATGLTAMNDGKLVMATEGPNGDHTILAVFSPTLPNSASTIANASLSTTPGTVIDIGLAANTGTQEPDCCTLPDGSVLVICRMGDGSGFAWLARATYSNGQLTLASALKCDGTGNNPYLIAGSSTPGIAVIGKKVYAFVTEPFVPDQNRQIVRVYECPWQSAMGGVGIGNQWVESAISPIWNSCSGSHVYGFGFGAANGQIRGTFGTSQQAYFGQFNSTEAPQAAGSGGGGGNHVLGIGL